MSPSRLTPCPQVNRGLSSIVLRANNIDDAEGADFADMLLLNTTLVEVDLSGNRLRHCGKAFVNAFLANPSLQELFLEGNEIEEVLMFQVAQGRQLNHEPRHLRNLIPLLGSKECPKDVDLSYSADVHDRPLDDTSASILATALVRVPDLSCELPWGAAVISAWEQSRGGPGVGWGLEAGL